MAAFLFWAGAFGCWLILVTGLFTSGPIPQGALDSSTGVMVVAIGIRVFCGKGW